MSTPNTRTADGHEVEIGGRYWDNNLDRVEVTGVSHDETNQNTGTVARWYTTKGLDRDRRGIFDGSRLARRHPGTGEVA